MTTPEQCEARARRCADCREFGRAYDYRHNAGCIWGSKDPEQRGNTCFNRNCDPRRDAVCQPSAANPCDGSSDP